MSVHARADVIEALLAWSGVCGLSLDWLLNRPLCRAWPTASSATTTTSTQPVSTLTQREPLLPLLTVEVPSIRVRISWAGRTSTVAFKSLPQTTANFGNLQGLVASGWLMSPSKAELNGNPLWAVSQAHGVVEPPFLVTNKKEGQLIFAAALSYATRQVYPEAYHAHRPDAVAADKLSRLGNLAFEMMSSSSSEAS